MAKKQTKIDVDIANEPRRLRSSESYLYIDEVSADLAGEVDEVIKILAAALRARITTAMTELKDLHPNQSVTIKPGEVYIGEFELPVLISREETDNEVAARVRAAAVQRAKDIAALEKLTKKLGVTVTGTPTIVIS